MVQLTHMSIVRIEVVNVCFQLAYISFKSLWKNSCDTRHERLKVLVKQEVNKRIFAEWTIAYRKISVIDLNELSEIISWPDIIQNAEDGDEVPKDKIIEIFQKFRYKL